MATNQNLRVGVNVREVDLTDIVQSEATSRVAMVIPTRKGSLDVVGPIATEKDYITEYGVPVATDVGAYAAISYLKKGRELYVKRIHNSALYGGVEILTAASSSANADWAAGQASISTFTFSTDGLLAISAKDPGAWSDDLRIKLTTNVADANAFDITLTYVDNDGNDYIVEEILGCTRTTATDGYGIQTYVVDKTANSMWIRVIDNTTVAAATLPKVQETNLACDGGADGSAVTDSEYVAGWDAFANREEISVNLLCDGGRATATVQNKIITLCESRDDCFGLLSCPLDADTQAEMSTYRTTTLNANTSYAALYGPWVKDFDQYTNTTFAMAPSGFAAGVCAYNDYVRAAWYAPAGLRRGVIKASGVTKILSEAEMNTLHGVQVNPIASTQGQGIYIWGDYTLQSWASALQFIGIRRMLLVVKNSMRRALRQFIFDPNDEVTELRVTQMLEEYLEGIKQQRGLEQYAVVTDRSRAAEGILGIMVRIVPMYSVRAINLTMVLTKAGVQFTETTSANI